jgi:3',5'-cyclic AMP phosphodiesterase CpdA
MTDEITTLAQITDVHLPPVMSLRPWIWNLKRSVGMLNWYRNRRNLHLAPIAYAIAADAVAQSPDAFAITGDLASLGLPGEFGTGIAWLKTLGDMRHVALIPGNHDIYTKGCDVVCLREWAHYMRSDEWGREFLQGAEGFPYVRRVGNLAIVALNSAVPTRLFIASGRIGERQLKALAAILDRLKQTGLIRVVLLHHPPLKSQAPQRRALEDADALDAVLKQHGADLVLHGHNHRDSLVWTGAAGAPRIPIVGLATGSTGREHRHEPLARYNLYRISGTPGAARIEIVSRGLESARGKIIELRRQVLQPDAALSATSAVMQVP